MGIEGLNMMCNPILIKCYSLPKASNTANVIVSPNIFFAYIVLNCLIYFIEEFMFIYILSEINAFGVCVSRIMKFHVKLFIKNSKI